MVADNIRQILKNATFLGKHESGSASWHELRNQLGVISGSEIGAICGTSPFTSAFTLWAEKTGKVDRDFVGSDAMRLGQLVEPAIRQLYSEKHPGHEILEVEESLAHHEHQWMHANLDGLGIDENGQAYILEIKHTAMHWDEIPLHYQQQVMWYMAVTGLRHAVFAVVNAGRFKEYKMEWSDFEWDVILQRVTDFRSRVLQDVQPDWDGSDSTYETTRKMVEGIESRNEELGQLGIELFNAQDAVDAAETHLTEMKSRVVSALNGAKYGVINGKVVCTLSQRAGGVPFLTVKKADKK